MAQDKVKRWRVTFLCVFFFFFYHYIDCRIFYGKRQDRQIHILFMNCKFWSKDALLLVIVSDVILHFYSLVVHVSIEFIAGVIALHHFPSKNSSWWRCDGCSVDYLEICLAQYVGHQPLEAVALLDLLLFQAHRVDLNKYHQIEEIIYDSKENASKLQPPYSGRTLKDTLEYTVSSGFQLL